MQTVHQENERFHPEAFENYLNIRAQQTVKVVDRELEQKLGQQTDENAELKRKLEELLRGHSLV